MAENLELVRQAVQTIKNETEDGANTAARVGGVMGSILEYSHEQITAEAEIRESQIAAEADKRVKSDAQIISLTNGINNRVTALEEKNNVVVGPLLTELQGSVETLNENVNTLSENVGEWESTGNGSIAEEIGSHYAEESDENYTSGLWGQMRNSRGRLSQLETKVGSNATSEEDDGSVWGQLKWHSSEISGIHMTLAKTIKSGGKINLSSISAANLASIMASLSDTEIAMYLITDSSGNLPSLDGETAITITDTAKKLLFGKTDNFGVSVGDILAVTKLTCKVIPLNEAKPVNGDFPGADGLESVWDKGQINKIAGIETKANAALPRVDRLPSKWGDNMNDNLNTGVYPWCTLGRPAGSTGAYTLIVNRTSTNDGSYDTIEQTAYGRQGELGRIFKRIIFYKSDGSDTQYGDWQEITGSGDGGILTVGSVEELPADAEIGTVAAIVENEETYATKVEELIGVPLITDATSSDFTLTGSDFASIGDCRIKLLYVDSTNYVNFVIANASDANNVEVYFESPTDGYHINTFYSKGSVYDSGINSAISFLNENQFTFDLTEINEETISYLEPFLKVIPKLKINKDVLSDLVVKDSYDWKNVHIGFITDSVSKLPKDVKNGTLGVVCAALYASNIDDLLNKGSYISCDATLADFPDPSDLVNGYVPMNNPVVIKGNGVELPIYISGEGIYFNDGTSNIYLYNFYNNYNPSSATINEAGIQSFIDSIPKDGTITATRNLSEDEKKYLFKFLPKFKINATEVSDIYIKNGDKWTSPVEEAKIEVKKEITAKTKKIPIVVYSSDDLPEDAELGQLAIIINAKYINGMALEDAKKRFVYYIDATADECFNNITSEDLDLSKPKNLFDVYYTLNGELKSFRISYHDYCIWYGIDGTEIDILWENGVGKNIGNITNFINSYNDALNGEAIYIKEDQSYTKQILKWIPKLGFEGAGSEDCSFAIKMNYEWYHY